VPEIFREEISLQDVRVGDRVKVKHYNWCVPFSRKPKVEEKHYILESYNIVRDSYQATEVN